MLPSPRLCVACSLVQKECVGEDAFIQGHSVLNVTQQDDAAKSHTEGLLGLLCACKATFT